jgi:hypothetical protein
MTRTRLDESTTRKLGALYPAAIAALPACRGGAAAGGEVPPTLDAKVDPSSVKPARAIVWFALRETGDARAGFGGDRGPQARGRIVYEHGGACAELEAACPEVSPQDPSKRTGRGSCDALEGKCPEPARTLLAQGSDGRTFVYVENGAAHAAKGGEIMPIFGSVDSAEKAAMVAWLAGYDLEWYDERGLLVRGAQARVAEGGFEVLAGRSRTHCSGFSSGDKEQFVGTTTERILLSVDARGAIREKAVHEISRNRNTSVCMPMGRRPAGLVAATFGQDAGAYFARAAHLESASITAFQRLAADLDRFGARALARRARRAARDEARHASIMQTLARRFGGDSTPPEVHASCTQSLEQLATENAVEGCVLEAYAAGVAMLQAERAASPAVRRVMARIARDEVRHAALALDVDRWAERRLDRAARARVDAARAGAIVRLRRVTPSPTPVEAWAGHPSRDDAERLIDAVAAARDLQRARA